MSIEIVKTDNQNSDFQNLIQLLDLDLGERYGELQKQFDKHNKVDHIRDVVVLYKDGVPAGCGAFKALDSESVELKRIFVSKDFRKQGLGERIVHVLEEEASKKGYRVAFLETGSKQFEAIALYKKLGYEIVENYGPYVGSANSVCMRKAL